MNKDSDELKKTLSELLERNGFPESTFKWIPVIVEAHLEQQKRCKDAKPLLPTTKSESKKQLKTFLENVERLTDSYNKLNIFNQAHLMQSTNILIDTHNSTDLHKLKNTNTLPALTNILSAAARNEILSLENEKSRNHLQKHKKVDQSIYLPFFTTVINMKNLNLSH